MKTFKSLILLLAVMGICQLELQASGHSKSCHKKKHVDQIVGTYTEIITVVGAPPSSTAYSYLSFHKDGTFQATNTADLGGYNPATPNGIFVGVLLGQWKKTGKNTYATFSTSVATTTGSSPNPLLPTSPFSRSTQLGTLTYDPATQTYVNNVTLNGYALTDSTLSSPTPLAQLINYGTKVNLLP